MNLSIKKITSTLALSVFCFLHSYGCYQTPHSKTEFGSAKVGLTESEIRTLLGPPKRYERISDRSSSVFRNVELERKFGSLRVMLYKSSNAEEDLLIYLSADGRVVYVERLHYFENY